MAATTTEVGCIYKPSVKSWLYYFTALAPLLCGASLIAARSNHLFSFLYGAAGVVIGIHLLSVTAYMRRCWYVVTPQEIVRVRPNSFLAIRWDELSSVEVRERAIGLQERKRVIIVRAIGMSFEINAFLLCEGDEAKLLEHIRRLAPSSVRRD